MSEKIRRVWKVGELLPELGLGIPRGCEDTEILRVCPPEEAERGCVVVIPDGKTLKELKGSPSLLIHPEGLEVEGFPCAVGVKNPRLVLAKILELLHPARHPVGISPKASVGKNVRIGKNVYIGDFTFIGDNVVLEDNVKVYPGCYIGNNTVIGRGSVLYPHVFVGDGTVIGENIVLHPGAVVGKEGFGFVFDGKEHVRLRHIGTVVVENNTEIGANSCVDRALLGKTVVGEGTKVDNLVQIAHNDMIGKHVILVSQVGLSGSVEIGDYSILAGQVGVADHVRIGRGVKVAAKSGVASDLEDGKTYGANLPAVEWSLWKRIYILLLKLPEIYKTVRKFQKILKDGGKPKK